MWAVCHRVVGQRGGGVCQLQDGEGVVALADADRRGFTREPWLLEALLLPGRRRQQPGLFVGQVDAGEPAKAPGRHEVVNAVHAQIVGSAVVIGVGRDHDGLVQVHTAVSLRLGVAEAVLAQHPVARVLDRVLGLAHLVFQHGQRHEGLVGGAGRVGAAQRPVQQRPIGIAVQRLPVAVIDAVNEQIGVEAGHRHEGQNFTGTRLDGHQRAPIAGQQFFGQLLQRDVQRQPDVLAGRGRLP